MRVDNLTAHQRRHLDAATGKHGELLNLVAKGKCGQSDCATAGPMAVLTDALVWLNCGHHRLLPAITPRGGKPRTPPKPSKRRKRRQSPKENP